LTRLDHVESKVELQRYELDQIKHEHEELKAMVLVLKNDRKTESDKIEASLTTISPDENLSNFDNRNPAKRPARLLPYRVLLKYKDCITNPKVKTLLIHIKFPGLSTKREKKYITRIHQQTVRI